MHAAAIATFLKRLPLTPVDRPPIHSIYYRKRDEDIKERPEFEQLVAGYMSRAREKPLVIFDGECGFCRKYVESWRARTGDRMEYAPFQEVAERFPEFSRVEFEGAVQFLDVDGQRYSGAEAVFRVMSYVPGKGWWLWLYCRVPGFAPISRLVYRWIARHRKWI